MGQRTAIVLQHVNKWNETINTRVFYHQLGIGRILPAQFMSILHGTLSADAFGEHFVKNLLPQGCDDITSEYEQKDLNSASFESPEIVGKIIEDANNNNGGIFIRTTFGKECCIESIEYAYMLGYEEGGDYKSFCTQEEWMEKNCSTCIDDEFKEMYYKTLAYYGAQEIKEDSK